MKFFLLLFFLLVFETTVLKAKADYTCSKAISLVDKKSREIKKEIYFRKLNPGKTLLDISRLKSINKQIQLVYKITQKSRVGSGFLKYSKTDWQEHNPAELIVNIQENKIDLDGLNEYLIDLKKTKQVLIDFNSSDALCDFEIAINPWIEDIHYSLPGKYPEIFNKFDLFTRRNLEILEILPSSPGLIREEFEDEIFNKAELKAVVKQEIKNRRLMIKKVVRIYRSTKKLS
jgi:hypothetical protein